MQLIICMVWTSINAKSQLKCSLEMLSILSCVARCKKSVNAEKQFTLHDAPLVLTVHLKRFSPLGRKIGHHIKYDEKVSLQPFMSEGHFGPTYSLYGVICHACGGPNSGHYYAFVKGRDGWYEMNDELVTRHRGAPVSLKSAYVLFYLRERGQALEAAINSISAPNRLLPPTVRLAMRKRKVVESDEEEPPNKGVQIAAPLIGPRLPSPSPSPSPSPALSSHETPESKRLKPSPDRQAELVKKKIEAVTKSSTALDGLAFYSSSGDDENDDRRCTSPKSLVKSPVIPHSTPSSPPSSPPSSRPVFSLHPISPTSFYGISNDPRVDKFWNNKHRSPRWKRDHNSPSKRRNFNPATSPGDFSSPRARNIDPYSRLKNSNNLRPRQFVRHTYGRRRVV